MVRVAVDEDFNNDILRALARRCPTLDFVRVQDCGLSGCDDAALLEWAARERRVLLTHDVSTMTTHVYDRLRSGKELSGLWVAPQDAPVARLLDDLLLLVECSLEDEWKGLILYLPLK